jgi:hypothetical protein
MMLNLPEVTDTHAKEVCKLGQGAACCRYLTMGPRGWSCEKHGDLRYYIDDRANAGKMTAVSDNCDGRASR